MKKYYLVTIKKAYSKIGNFSKLVYAYDKDHAINLSSGLMGGISPEYLTAKKV